ncbi:hypothetical protein J6590_079111 [Homalodisca vitripennis]|nr:hypothetical protein J6590_079111 [Homalodisca vitripennis]
MDVSSRRLYRTYVATLPADTQTSTGKQRLLPTTSLPVQLSAMIQSYIFPATRQCPDLRPGCVRKLHKKNGYAGQGCVGEMSHRLTAKAIDLPTRG